MLGEFVLIFILIFLSAFFSSSEMAYITSNKIKIEIRARKKNLPARSAQYFISNPDIFFSTILIGNNAVNIALASLSTIILSSLFGWDEYQILLVSTFILLIFGELVPKYLARELADSTILFFSLPLRLFSFIIYPLIRLASSLSAKLTQSSNVKAENINQLFSKEDFETLVKESHTAGAVDKKESEIISKVIALGDQRVYEAMRPRTEIVGVEIDQSIEEVVSVFIDSGYSKLPVYEENLDNIKGVILAYDLFNSPKSLKEITREILFVPETKKSFELLNEFLSKRVSIAVVIDEFGGTAGLVTMEDIIEELFGEIKDEYDVEEDICRRTAPGTYLISGKVEIDLINEKYNLNFPQGDYETIGGFIASEVGRIPPSGETITIENYTFLIVRATYVKIELVKLTVNPDLFPEEVAR
ncbi:MAG: HlyC/CorC family transporter [Ignavibacteriales bacterium]|nr:MAG: HlyC/CorC family transporter [Ignavibacteriales bacterium]